MSAHLDALEELERHLYTRGQPQERAAILLKDVGWVTDKGKRVLALRVFVSTSADPESVAGFLPKTIHGIPVRAVKCKSKYLPGRGGARGSGSGRVDKLIGGVSIAHVRSGARGTLGAVMYDAVTGDPLMLSCAHVLVNDDPKDQLHPDRDLIAQPESVLDEDIVGQLVRADADLDCAVAKVFPNKREFSSGILGHPIQGIVPTPEIDTEVFKVGVRSGTTWGKISGVGATTVTISPSEPTDEEGRNFAMEGDSGSIWLEKGTNMAVGLLSRIHVGDHGLEAVASRISRVAEALRITWKEPRL